MLEFSNKRVACADNCNAMEAETIQKNAVSPKNRRSRKNLLLFFIVAMFVFTSCATSPYKMKADFVGFSDKITTSYNYTNKCIVKKWRKQSPPFDLIVPDNGVRNEDGVSQMRIAVYSSERGEQTPTYSALDAALNRVEYVQRKFMENDPNSKYYVVMLTDGIDTQAQDKDSFGKKIQERMNTLMKKYCFFNLFKSKKPNTTNSFESYVLLYKGKDLKETNLSDDQLRTLLTPFAGAQNAPKDEDRVIIKEDINELVNIFEERLISRSFRFSVPVGFNGQNIRMVLTPKDGANPIYFEGDFSIENNLCYLKNIKTSDGFSVKLPDSKYLVGSIDNSSGNNSKVAIFEAEDLKLNGKPYRVNKGDVNQWHTMLGTYVLNSEYNSAAGSHKNAYLIVLLDSSLSFADQFEKARNAIMRIVDIVSNL